MDVHDFSDEVYLGDLRGLKEILSDGYVWDNPPTSLQAKCLGAVAMLRKPPRPTVRRLGARWSLSGLALAAALTGFLVWQPDFASDEAANSFQLAGTQVAPDARGVASVTRTDAGLEIHLDVTNLPPAAPDEYYQGWIKDETNAITVGTFHMRNGSEEVTLWSGIDSERYSTFTVTLQKIGGGQKSSGIVVLSGKLY
ncbi:anti-sigma factor [Streptomyces cinereoruber]|uniref:anti-sigma factor n=1 Tax=Streptomyces cinereoruber TaxID=67260 RepID=UPI00363BFF95